MVPTDPSLIAHKWSEIGVDPIFRQTHLYFGIISGSSSYQSDGKSDCCAFARPYAPCMEYLPTFTPKINQM